MAVPNIKRNLEAGTVYIAQWHSGLYTQRSPIYTPLSAMGLQMVSRYDTLWDGVNMELSNSCTLVRRPGFPRFCSQQLGSSSAPLTYKSFKNLSGTIKLLADCQDAVYTFSPTTLTSLFAKSTTAQTSFQTVGNSVYMVDGTDAKKWNGTTVSGMGISAPLSAPSLSFVANGQLAPQSGYLYGYAYKNSTSGHVGTMSPASANTGPLANQTVAEGQVTLAITSVQISSNVAIIQCTNNAEPGQKVAIKGLTGAAFLNGSTLTVSATGLSSSQFEAPFTHANYAPTADSGTGTLTVSVPNTGPYQYTVQNAATWLTDGGVVNSATSKALTAVAGIPTTGQYSVTAGVYTFASADAGNGLVISYTFSLTTSTGINIAVAGPGSTDPQVDTVEIYRTDDGGSLYYLLTDIPNATNWTYTDSTPDSGLDDDIVAAIDDANDPPEAGLSLLVYHMGRLWGASGNNVFFAAGPDATIGIGEEAWPPANFFGFPGKVTALASTSVGLVVNTGDDMFIIYGTSTASFYSAIYQKNLGVQNQNCVAQDGDLLFLYTSGSQLFCFSDSLTEVGFPVGDKFQATFNPATTYLALHRNGSDAGLFISDGSTNVYRYRIDQSAWSTVAQVVGGAGTIASIETSTANYTLLTGRTTGSGYILGRSLTTFQDDSVSYPAFATVGTLILAPPGSTAKLESVLIERMPVGSDVTVSVSLDEINGTFVPLPNPVSDPPLLKPSTSIIAKRHYLKAAATPLPQQIRHLQVKLTFATENFKNEILSLGLD